jgi:glyceraldehyde-3-phosphate dehydrogenase (NADP+)
MEAFRDCFPKGVVNFISGFGRETSGCLQKLRCFLNTSYDPFKTVPAIMESGKLDIFAFIGGSKVTDKVLALISSHFVDMEPLEQAADALIKVLPNPHRVRFSLALDAKNVGVVLKNADLKIAVDECVLGSLSYNGQRCTALKLLFVHEV